MIFHTVACISTTFVPEGRVRMATISSTGDCDTWDCKLIPQFYFYFNQNLKLAKKSLTLLHDGDWKHPFQFCFLSISVPSLQKPLSSGLMVKEGLGVMMRTALEIRTMLYGVWGQPYYSTTFSCCFFTFLEWYCPERIQMYSSLP